MSRINQAAEPSLIFWFGAGLSGASGMPLGMQLTEQWQKNA
jgi:hypothetical protein